MRLEEEKKRLEEIQNLKNSIVIPRGEIFVSSLIGEFLFYVGWIWSDEYQHNINVLNTLIHTYNCKNGNAQTLMNLYNSPSHIVADVGKYQYHSINPNWIVHIEFRKLRDAIG